MAQTGIGVMLGLLGGNAETVDTVKGAIGKRIIQVGVDEARNELRFTFQDGTGIRLFDDGQSCCEHRYMKCDDALDYFGGAELLSLELRDVKEEDGPYGDVKEIQFLVVKTSRGAFTVANYNEHNGYYGGFWIVARPLENAPENA